MIFEIHQRLRSSLIALVVIFSLSPGNSGAASGRALRPAESLNRAYHRIIMLLQPARRDGRRYMNPVPTKVGGLSVMFKVGPRFFLDAKARSPQGPLGPFHTDPRIYAAPPASGLRITWMGHATSLVETDGVRILIDPVWDERAAPTTWTGPKRFFPAPLKLGDLPLLDAILISHDHYDHLGAGTIRALAHHGAAKRAKWVTPLGVGALLKQFGVPTEHCVELNWMDA